MPVSKSILSEENRSKLDGIVSQMQSNGEPEDNIRFVVEDFKTKYAEKKNLIEHIPEKSSATPIPLPSQPTVQNTKQSVFKNDELDEKLRTANMQSKESVTSGLGKSKEQELIETQQVAEAPKRAALKKERTDKAVNIAAKKILESNGIKIPEGEALDVKKFARLEAEKKKIQDDIYKGNAALVYDKKQKDFVLKRTTGFLDTFADSWNHSTKANDEAYDFVNNMNTSQRLEYRKNIQNQEEKSFPYEGKVPSRYAGSMGQFLGESGPIVAKGAAAATAGALLATASPFTGGLTLAGLPAAMGFLFTAPDMVNHSAQKGILERFDQLKKQHPDWTDEEAMDEADDAKWASGTAGLGNAALLMTTGGNLLKAPISQSGKSVFGEVVRTTINSGAKMGAIGGGIEAARQAEGLAEGIDVNLEEAYDKTIQVAKDNATLGSMLHLTMMGAGKVISIPPMVYNAAKKAVVETAPLAEIKVSLEANEKAGNIPSGTTEKVVKDLEEYKAALEVIPEDVPEVAKTAIAGLLQKKKGLIEKEASKEEIEAVDNQIAEINKTGKIEGVEFDNLTGEKIQPSTIESVIAAADEVKVPALREAIKNGDEETINEVLKEVSDQWHDEGIRMQAERDFGKTITDAAKEMFPQESKESLSVEPSTESKNLADIEIELPDMQQNTRSEATKKIIAFAEKVFDKKFEGDFNKGEYVSWLQSLGDEGYEAANLLNSPKKAVAKLKESATYKEKFGNKTSIHEPSTVKSEEVVDMSLTKTDKTDVLGSVPLWNLENPLAKKEVNGITYLITDENLVNNGKKVYRLYEDKKLISEHFSLADAKKSVSELSENKPIQSEETKVELSNTKEKAGTTNEEVDSNIGTSTEATGAGGKEPPKGETVEGKEEVKRLNPKALANRLVNAKNIPEAAKKGIEKEGLEYEPQSKEEAQRLANTVIEEIGMDEAVAQAREGKFGGDVNTLIQTESLNKLAELSDKAQSEGNTKLQTEYDTKFAEIGIELDKSLRKQGRGISAIDFFYKKSPLGIQLIENAKRKEDFEQWAKPKDKSWKEAFYEMMKEPDFEAAVKEKVSEGMKQERAKAREARIKKVDDIIDKAKDQFKGGAAYSTIIPPQVITAALEGIKQAWHGGEFVVKIVQDAIDFISKELGHKNWDIEKFRKEWEEKLRENEKTKLTDEEIKAKYLDRIRKKLKGLTDKQKEEVIIKLHNKIIDSGGLDFADFRNIIAKVTGRGEMTEVEASRLRELVKKTNAVDNVGKQAREQRTPQSLKNFRKAEIEAGEASRELNTLLYNRPNITKRLTSMLQLNTLGIAALVNNPIYNVVNHLGLRLPVGVVKTALDKTIYGVGKIFRKDYKPETNITSLQVQREFFKKLGLGTRESVGQFLTGLNRMDYMHKEIHGQQIQPLTAIKDLWDFSQGKKNLTKTQVIDKILQASPQGMTAELIARTLNLGDKPMRFASEGAQAATFAKSLGLKDVDYNLFIEFPREEAYRVYKSKGLSDADAGKQADYIKDTIVKEGERSTFQQDNFANDILNRIFGGEQSGVGGLIKATVISPYIKIPANAYWSYFNLVNPEVAMTQSFVYASKAFAKRNGNVKFSFDKNNSTASKDLHEAKYWLAHAAVGYATRAVITSLVASGIFRSANTEDDTKKEREGEQNYEQQGTINVSKLHALMKGENPDDVKNGLVVQNRWFGHFGSIGNTVAKREEEMTPEQRANRDDYWAEVMGNLELSSLKELEQGIFGNTSSLLSSLDRGGMSLRAWEINTINMFGNVVHPAAFAQVSKAQLPYYSKNKADTFLEELNNNALSRSKLYRTLSGKYPPSKVGIWGDTLEKKDNVAMRIFGISRSSDDNFAQPLYEDYKRTNNTKFFPSAVKPEISDGGVKIKLNTKETAELETLVGQQRKSLAAPYINDLARFEGSYKNYNELSDEEKTEKLQILYDVGYEKGEYLFRQLHPEYKPKQLTPKQENKAQDKRDENEELRQSAKDKLKLE